MRSVLILVILLSSTQGHAAETPSVAWQIAREAGGPIDATQRWLQFMERVSPRSIRFRRAHSGEKPSVERISASNSYTVTAVLTKRNRLQLPGREISLGDLAGLSAWIEQLSDTSDGASATREVGPFGLDAGELKRLRGQLATGVHAPTRGQPIVDVFESLRKQVRLVVTIDAHARDRLAGSDALVADEFQGVSLGTSLAALLRPLDLVLVPQSRSDRTVMLRIREARRTPDAWPVGWKADQPDRLVLPKLLEKLPVEIADMPIERVLAALEPRLGCPMLVDHAQIAATHIDLTATKITFKAKRTFYQRILDQVLFQARLQLEVRVDDAGNGFLWIEPLTIR